MSDSARKPRPGLGRGLSALMGDMAREAPVTPGAAASVTGIRTLPVASLAPHPEQPRIQFDEDALDELADSIRERGVLQPILLRPNGEDYLIIAGERRRRASILAEQTMIPALIREDATDHGKMIELALIENLQRADLHPLEEAWAFGVMRDELGYSYRKIAERVGRSKGYVENRLKLLDLDDDLQQLVHDRPDTLMHVVELAKVPDLTARATLIAAVREGLSYPETQARVRALLAPPVSEGSLYKDSHDRQPDGDHAATMADEVSLRKDSHDRQPDGGHAPAAAGERRTALVTLSERERATLAGLGEKLAHWLDNPAHLPPKDWEILAPIALRLRDLLHYLNE